MSESEQQVRLSQLVGPYQADFDFDKTSQVNGIVGVRFWMTSGLPHDHRVLDYAVNELALGEPAINGCVLGRQTANMFSVTFLLTEQQWGAYYEAPVTWLLNLCKILNTRYVDVAPDLVGAT